MLTVTRVTTILLEFSESARVDDELLERAAIVEFDGGFARDEAEQFARTGAEQ